MRLKFPLTGSPHEQVRQLIGGFVELEALVAKAQSRVDQAESDLRIANRELADLKVDLIKGVNVFEECLRFMPD